MLGFGPISGLPISATPSASGVFVTGSLYSPATSGAQYVGSLFQGGGGTAPYSYVLTDPNATGLVINSSTGLVTGLITVAPGTYTGIFVTATDSLLASGNTLPFTLVVEQAGIAKWPGHQQRLRAFWYNPRRRTPGQGFPPVPVGAQYRRRRTLQAAPSAVGQEVFKFQSYAILSNYDDRLSLFKFNAYIVLDAPLPQKKSVRHWHRFRADNWRWKRSKRRLTPPTGRLLVTYTIT